MKDLLSQRVRAVPPSGLRRYFDIIATMDGVISLGIGEPDFVTPGRIRQAGIRSLDEGFTGYTSNSGLIELRQALAEHLKRRYGVCYDPETELLITVGVSEALHVVLMSLVDAGDEVIVPEPCFVAYKACVAFADGTPVTIDTRVEDRFQVTAAQVRAALSPRTKALLLGYPSNPTGAVLEPQNALDLAALATQEDLLVISDEIYDRLVYGVDHICFPSLPGMRERTVLLGGFSKDYAMTGWRIGYVAGPPEIVAAARKVHQYIIMSAPTMAQTAALEALRSGEDEVQAMVASYDERRRLIVDGLNRIGLPCFEPLGAFYVFPSVAGTGLSCEEFADRLLFEEKVAVVPGTAFGQCGEGYVRCAYATSKPAIGEALERMARFVRRCRS
ncbi:MAG: aminotransferase class I/II-fold pyridoxal phosphate-dependent enzyme [Anaerolineae bacterium]